MSKLVYSFGAGLADGDASMKNLLGGKGANLAEMNKIGLPVPPGFTITTEVCTAFYALGQLFFKSDSSPRAEFHRVVIIWIVVLLLRKGCPVMIVNGRRDRNVI